LPATRPRAGADPPATLSVNPFTASGLLEGLEPGDSVLINAAGSALASILLLSPDRRQPA
jgi:NADPH:quinone reductase-like Zn-dependent oxidoreductase